MSERKTYHGQCQCGAVRYSVVTDLANLGDCNCSRCRRLGWVMHFAPVADFTLESGADNLSLYKFNTHKIDHQFCTTCGIESFARGVGPDGAAMVVINVNCLEPAVPVDRGTIQHYDGANW